MIPTTHLDLIINRWHDLAQALTATTRPASWPPAGRLVTHLRQTEDPETQRAARDGSGAGEHPAPLNLDVLDTMQAVQATLVDLADQVAALIQRPAISHAPRDWPPADRARRDQLADADAADPRRWRYTGTRTAPYAAAWLAARLDTIPGPFAPLPGTEAGRIGRTAQTAAEQVLRALAEQRRGQTLNRPCHCGGRLDVYGGDGTAPAVNCRDCGRTWAAAA